MSTSPAGSPLPRENKFIGESFGLPNVRTIFAGAEEDSQKRDNRVVLLIGPQSAGKSSLIDLMCNHFYGAEVDGTQRYHIANEQFDSSTPHKSIITYIFNDTVLDVRPIVIDTPGTGEHVDSNELSDLLVGWMQDNLKMRVDVVGVVLSSTIRMSTREEEELQKTIDLLPLHMRSNMVVFITGSDGSPFNIGILKRFNLHIAHVFKVNASSLFQQKQEDALQEHLRSTYWRMSMGNVKELLYYIKEHQPVTVSGLPYDKYHFPGSIKDSGSESSFSSRQNSLRRETPQSSTASVRTIVHKEPIIDRTVETTTTSRNFDRSTTVTSSVNTRNSVVTEEKETTHSPQLVLTPATPLSKRPPSPPLPPPPLRVMQSSATPAATTTYLPTTLLDEIRSPPPLKATTERDPFGPEDDVIVVEYDKADAEVVVLRNSPSRPQSAAGSRNFDYDLLHRYDNPPTTEVTPTTRSYDLPPAMSPAQSRPYEAPSGTSRPSYRPYETTTTTITTSRHDDKPTDGATSRSPDSAHTTSQPAAYKPYQTSTTTTSRANDQPPVSSQPSYKPYEPIIATRPSESSNVTSRTHDLPSVTSQQAADKPYEPAGSVTSRPYDLPPITSTSPYKPYEALPSALSTSRPYDLPPVTMRSPEVRPPREHRKSVTKSWNGDIVTKFSSDTVHKNDVRPQQERTRIYSDETTPPPLLSPVSKSVTTTHSTRGQMHDNGVMTTDTMKTTYIPVTRTEPQPLTAKRSPTSPYGTLTSQLRHQNEGSPTRYETTYSTSRPAHPIRDSPGSTPPSSEELAELQRTQSARTNKTESPLGDDALVRYVYDVGSRSHKAHAVGDRRSSRMSRDYGRKRDSRSLDSQHNRETTLDEPYYSGEGYTETRQRSPQRASTHSLNRLSQPELIHSEDRYAFIDPATKKPKASPSPAKETVIDFPYVPPPFERDAPNRRSRRHSGPSRSAEDLAAPVPARRTSLGRKSADDRRAQTLPRRVDTRDNPEFSLQPYRKTQHQEEVTDLMRQREEMLRRTREEVQRNSYPGPSRQGPHYANLPLGQGAVPENENTHPQVSPNRNEHIIPPQMRGNQSPIQVRVDMREKQRQAREKELYQPPPLPTHQYKDSDYGDQWDERSVRTTQQQQPREQTAVHRATRPPNLAIGEGAAPNGAAKRVNQGNDPRSPAAPPPYPARQYPATPRTPTQHQQSGGDSDVEQGRGQERRPLQAQNSDWKAKSTRGKMVTGGVRTTTTTTTTARIRNRTSYWGEEFPRWKVKYCLATFVPLTIALILLIVLSYALYKQLTQ